MKRSHAAGLRRRLRTLRSQMPVVLSLPVVVAFLLYATAAATGGSAETSIAGSVDETQSQRGSRIVRVTPERVTAATYERVELSVELEREYDNPYDPEIVDLSATFRAPSGKEMTIPAFFHQTFRRVDAIPGVAVPTGEWGWKVRFAADEPGEWTYELRLRDDAGESVWRGGQLTVTAGDDRGYLRIDEGTRYFTYANGAPYFGIGENLSWWRSKPADYAEWLRRLGDEGANLIRVWMASWSLALEWNDTGLGRYDRRQERADHLDWLFDLAERHGIAIMLVLQNHGQWSARTNPEWEHNPYNARNGGPLASPEEFFTDERAKRLTQQRYRYIVARYGYRTNLLAWELFNEVDLTDGYDADAVSAWHREMAAYIKAIDPFGHPVTTSFSNPLLDPKVWSLPEIDFTNTHFYNATDMAASVTDHDARKFAAYGKATFTAEFGTDWRGESRWDREGVNLHNALWASAFGGAAATAMTWWWDTYVADRDLYHHFGTISAFLGDFTWINQGLRPAEPPVQTALKGAWAIPANIDWGGKPDDVQFGVSDGGHTRRPEHVARFMHGTRHNTHLRTPPVRFQLSVGEPVRLGVEVDTAARAGAHLEIAIDGKPVLQQAFPPSGSDTPVGETYYVTVPAGESTVTIENTGPDWLAIGGYTVDSVLPKARAYALVGQESALVWVQDREHTWSRVVDGYRPELISDAVVTLEGFAGGVYEIEVWDPWKGEAVDRLTAVAEGGRLAISAPPFRRDIAFKVRKAGP